MSDFFPPHMQEVRFDKSKGTVELMNARFLEKQILGYRRRSEHDTNHVCTRYVSSGLP